MYRHSGGLRWLPALSSLILLLSFCQAVGARSATGVIVGQVLDSMSGEPLSGATVALVDRYGGTVADEEGRFELDRLNPGRYRLRVSQVGYDRRVYDSLVVETGDTLRLRCELERRPVKLSGFTVAPGRFGLMEETPTTSTGLTRTEIETMPHLGDDLYRAIRRLPGVSSGDFSTRFRVRGGDYDEVLVTLDGQRLYEPFHLKDVDGGAMSIIDVAAVEQVEMMTGGFEADYGDAMSAVLRIDSRRPQKEMTRLSVGLSLLNARLLADGKYAGGRGEWLVSARRGYFDLALALAGEDDDLSPLYYDVFAKTRYRLGEHQIVGAHVLHAGDGLEFANTDNDADSLNADWTNSYAWLTLQSRFAENLTAFSLVGAGRYDHVRSGQGYNEYEDEVAFRVVDEETCDAANVRTDWQWDLSEKFLIRWGGEYRYLSTDFDYRELGYLYSGGFVAEVDTSAVVVSRSGRRYAAYVSGRWRPLMSLAAEAGLRYDRAEHTDGEHLAPRVNLRYDLSERMSLRLGWGYFYQSQEVSDLQVTDGDTLFYPDERAEHFTAGCLWRPAPGLMVRLEAYQKRYSDLRPEYRNLFDNVYIFPAAEWDRVRVIRSGAEARGLELYISRDRGGKLAWWLSYALAKADDEIEQVMTNANRLQYESTAPSVQDQRHTLYLDVAYRPASRWQINLAFNFHSGWPYTSRSLRVITDDRGRVVAYLTETEFWQGRLDSYQRLDIRVNRHFDVSKGRLTAFAEVINLFDRENVRRYTTRLVCDGDGCYLRAEPEYWFGLLPSVGITYSISF